jgi:glycosyltransferase involved in cell wall biosynthesis
MKKVTLAIPCYNVEKYIDEVMQGVLNQTYKPIEILLINDGSTDKTSKLIKRHVSDKVKIINHPFNLGLASVRNTSIVNAKGEYVAFLDGDVIPDKDWLKNILKGFRYGEEIVGVGGRLIERYTQTPADKWRAIHMS